MYLLATDYATDFALSSPELNDLIANLRARITRGSQNAGFSPEGLQLKKFRSETSFEDKITHQNLI